MIDEGKTHAQIAAAGEAAAELKQTAAGFITLRASYIDAWEKTDARDTTGREKLWVAMTILAKVETHLRSVVNNGVVAKREIEALRTAGEPRKRFGLV